MPLAQVQVESETARVVAGTATEEGEVATVGRPCGRTVASRVVGQTPEIAPAGVRHVDVGVVSPVFDALTDECDLRAVRRPVGRVETQRARIDRCAIGGSQLEWARVATVAEAHVDPTVREPDLAVLARKRRARAGRSRRGGNGCQSRDDERLDRRGVLLALTHRASRHGLKNGSRTDQERARAGHLTPCPPHRVSAHR